MLIKTLAITVAAGALSALVAADDATAAGSVVVW
jgi:hypothetical protein